jgi:hypothetical protein
MGVHLQVGHKCQAQQGALLRAESPLAGDLLVCMPLAHASRKVNVCAPRRVMLLLYMCGNVWMAQ